MDGAWSLPTDFGSLFSNLVHDLNQMVLLIVGGEDRRIWIPPTDGQLTLKESYN